jgi:hypothetical protein
MCRSENTTQPLAGAKAAAGGGCPKCTASCGCGGCSCLGDLLAGAWLGVTVLLMVLLGASVSGTRVVALLRRLLGVLVLDVAKHM